MKTNNLILLAEDFPDQFETLEVNLKRNKFEIVKCQNDEVDILTKCMEVQPVMVLFNHSEHDVDRIKYMIGFCNELANVPAFVNVYFAAPEDLLRQLEDAGVAFGIQSPFSYDKVTEYFKYVCTAAAEVNKRLKKHILEFTNQTLTALGISSSYLGRSYIESILKGQLFEFEFPLGLSEIYKVCEEEFSSPACNIKRALRTSVKAAWRNAPQSLKDKIFLEYAKADNIPDNKSFICCLVKFIRREFAGSYNFTY